MAILRAIWGKLHLVSGISQWASLVDKRVKCLPVMQETQVWSLGQEDPLEKEMATHSSILAWRIQWTEEPGRLQPTGSQRVGHDWVTSLTFTIGQWVQMKQTSGESSGFFSLCVHVSLCAYSTFLKATLTTFLWGREIHCIALAPSLVCTD